MAKYFLGSVGEARAFRIGKDNTKTEMFVATSITDQGINISSSQDELRAGTGAMVVATFNHDTSVEINLTDVFWKTAYVESKLGKKFTGNASDYFDEEVDVAAGVANLTKEPITANLPCGTAEQYIIWYKAAGDDEDGWKLFNGEINGKVLTFADTTLTGQYCFRYLTQMDEARELWVGADIVPDELFLVITTPIYAGDACAASNGNVAGHLTFEIPRYKLDPNLDLGFAMSSNTTMNISGKALAYTSGCNNNGSKLMRIVEYIDGREWYDGLQAIYIDPNNYNAAAGTVISVYGVYKNGSATKLNNAAEFTNESGNKVQVLTFNFASATHTVTVQTDSDFIIQDSDTITVASAVTGIENTTTSETYKKGQLK